MKIPEDESGKETESKECESEDGKCEVCGNNPCTCAHEDDDGNKDDGHKENESEDDKNDDDHDHDDDNDDNDDDDGKKDCGGAPDSLAEMLQDDDRDENDKAKNQVFHGAVIRSGASAAEGLDTNGD